MSIVGGEGKGFASFCQIKAISTQIVLESNSFRSNLDGLQVWERHNEFGIIKPISRRLEFA